MKKISKPIAAKPESPTDDLQVLESIVFEHVRRFDSHLGELLRGAEIAHDPTGCENVVALLVLRAQLQTDLTAAARLRRRS